MDKKCYDVIVVGAGPAGMMAAVTAAGTGAKVLLLEQKEQVGKKLLATGNGRCNYTNENMEILCFHGNRNLLETVLSQFGKEEAVSFLHEIGISPKVKRGGYYYPRSEQASSVVSAFLEELHQRGVSVHTNTRVLSLAQTAGDWNVGVTQYAYRGKTVIFASGLLASPQFGSDGSCFPLLEKLGHRFTPLVPALCGFVCTRPETFSMQEAQEAAVSGKGSKKKKDCGLPAGMRVEARVDLYIDGKKTASDTGEVQFTEYGISGIPVFQVSRFAALALKENKNVAFCLAFLPDMSREEVDTELCCRYRRAAEGISGASLLNGLLPRKLIPLILDGAGLPRDCRSTDVSREYLRRLAEAITGFTLTAVRVRDYAFAQVCAGGLCSEEINAATLESKKAKGIYFCGELLDVDGICGGFNLQWAWSSGYVAGIHSARAALGFENSSGEVCHDQSESGKASGGAHKLPAGAKTAKNIKTAE